MDIIGKSMQLKLDEAISLVKGMMAENRMRQEMAENLPPERRQRECQKLATDLEHIKILANILKDLAAAASESVRTRDFRGEAVQQQMQDIIRLEKGMLAECKMRMAMLDDLPPECKEEEIRRISKDRELIGTISRVLGSVMDAIIQGDDRDAEAKPLDSPEIPNP